ncbi:MAG: T9SS type A sorting domain-containing protein [Bacteroidales bacterium]|nr:T9SS type A sorting domain-containing protein [Bacteroidales bacterium]MCF8387145.1 T9SS type A sorting domain-containing protein [Bacteroidales bacterium]MCF8397641.1 T9SS type A sorting domain-containing protein [Bacteroidales bacterium]
MRPIFLQKHGCCAQASGIGYIFTYEINWMRNLSACDSVDEANWYPTHFTYNFLNEGDGENGSFIDDGWDIVSESGCPNVPTYGGMVVNNDATHWMTGYDNYLQALENRVDYYEKINFDTLQEDALDLLKQWLFNHNDDNEEAGGLASFCMKMDSLTYDIFPEDSPESGRWLVNSWIDADSVLFHQLTVVGYHDSVCYDFNGDSLYTNDVDLNGDSIITMEDWEYGALKVANSWGFWKDSGYVYLPYKFLAQEDVLGHYGKMFVLHMLEEYDPKLVFKVKLTHPNRKKIKILIDTGANALSQPSYFPDTLYAAFDMNGGGFPLLGNGNSEPLEVTLDYNYFYGNYNVGKYFLDIYETTPHIYDGKLRFFSLIDYRWNETFELNSGFMLSSIDSLHNRFHIDYDLIPHEDTITENLNLFSNMVSRFQPTVANNVTLSVDDSVKIDFYGSNLIITEGSTLSLGDHVVLTGKRDSSSIDIYGNLQIGSNVTFAADNNCKLYLNFLNADTTYVVNAVSFDGAAISSVCDSLTITNCDFNEGHVEKSGGSLLVDDCIFEDSYVYAFEGRTGKIIEISSCNFDNPAQAHSPVFIDYYENFNIKDDSIAYSTGSGISLYNSGGVDGADTFNIIDNVIYRKGGKRGESKDLGIKIYNSKAKILNGNYIYDNEYGISCLDYSQTKIRGYSNEGCDVLKQKIINNTEHQVYLSRASFPTDFNFNQIYLDTEDTTYLIYEKTNYQASIQCDVTYNFWGDSIRNPTSFIYTTMQPDYKPICTPTGKKSGTVESMYDSAVIHVVAGNYSDAENKFKEIIEDHSESAYSYAAVNQLFEIKRIHDQDYAGLKTYLDTTTVLQDTTDLSKLADVVSNKCDIELENYQNAIAFYEDIILNSGSYQDSLFAIIDLGYLYLRMNNNGNRSGNIGLLPQYIPKSRKTYELERDRLINLLFTEDDVIQVSEEMQPDDQVNQLIYQLNLFPNPVSSHLHIRFYTNEAVKLQFEVYDQTGRLVREMGSGNYMKGLNELQFDLAGLNAGIYFLSVKNQNYTILSKKLLMLE